MRQHMQLELRAIQRKLGATFLYVTHDQTEAMVMSDRIAVMNEGRIVQEGSARDIYRRPTSVFASDFIGDTNLIPGTVTSSADAIVTLAGADGSTLQGQASDAFPAGTKVILSVRPESIRVNRMDMATRAEAVSPSVASTASLTDVIAEVAEIIYLGNRVRVEAIGGTDVVYIADLRDEEAEDLERGTRVHLSWLATAASVWEDDAGSDGEQLVDR
jgi:ABC-type Fe3+/spermidine/putrescine transport system ATPase subunit